jgi:carbamoyltransferase
MKILGLNETSHDAAVSLIDGKGNILFAGHAERYSKIKNDWHINDSLMRNAYLYGLPDKIAYYEKPYLKKLRLILGGASGWKPSVKYNKSFSHHYSHAAAGYYTSPFKNAVIVVLDAIGEFTTSSVWVGDGDKIKLHKKWSYPFSFGLFYSAFTKLIGLKPNEEEYIMMGMAAYGDPKLYLDKVSEYFPAAYKQK